MSKLFNMISAVALGSSLSLLAPMASATVTGTLDVGSNGTVTATLAGITFGNSPGATGGSNFSCNAVTGAPCNGEVASGTSLSFSSLAGPALTNNEGMEVMGLSLSTVTPVNDFMTFSNNAGLDFSLSSIGNGLSNTNCASLAVGASCVIAGGEVLQLTNDGGSTTVTLFLGGTATDGSGGSSAWAGNFVETIVNNLPNGMAPTPGNIQAYFCGTATTIAGCQAYETTTGGTFAITNDSPEAGTFRASTTPEPGTLAMMGLGVGLVMFGIRRRARASR